jgi:ATP-dependent helicase/nuclease subunit B
MAGSLNGVYNIPAGQSFVDALAVGLERTYGGEPAALARVLVLLPTRRAVRSLREAFLRRHAGDPMLLPRMRPIGDVDDEELDIDIGGGGSEALDLPPAMDGLRRVLLLADVIARAHGDDIGAPQAALLARELAGFIDQLQTEDVPLSALSGLVPDDYAEHWQKVLAFLDVLDAPWRAILTAEDASDPMARRNLLLRAQADRWRARPPDYPVIAAGSTGSIPATADLLATVVSLPAGAVVLPGLDKTMDAAGWRAVGPVHPQYNLKRLLERMELDPAAVADWPAADAPASRVELLREAMRPSETTDAWRDLPPFGADAVTGLSRIDCSGPREEAQTIALLMREALETPGRTAALVTPDRGLGRRVAAELRRWQVDVDDSAGTPLAATPPGAFLLLTAEMLAEDLAPVALLAALKHPLAAAGRPRGSFNAMVRALDRNVLRGPRPAAGFDGLLAVMRTSSQHVTGAMLALVQDMRDAAAPAVAALAQSSVALSDLVRAHVAFAEWLARDETGDTRLWDADAGEAAMQFIAGLLGAGAGLREISPGGYAALLAVLMQGQTLRPRYGLHPRLNIWGPLEARLQQADLLILGGLNEGTWPAASNVDAWLSRPMREAAGLSPPERRIGLAAHDFVQAAAAPQVVLTRAAKVDGAPTVPSRWLLRLDQVLAAAGLQIDSQRAVDVAEWQDGLDRVDAFRPADPPAFAPPLDARPRDLFVTRIETWMRDPYQIFARYILKLRALDPLAADPGAADRGNVIHKALDDFIRHHRSGALPADAYAQLLDYGRLAFAPWIDRPGVRAFWWPRFERIARWFIETEAARRPRVTPLAAEAKGSLRLSDGLSRPFELQATADRVDRTVDGGLIIVDYKTGAVPSNTDIRDGLANQLPLEAAIAAAGGFADVPAGAVTGLEYWRIGGGRVPGEIRGAPEDASVLVDTAMARLMAWIEMFNDPKTPYRSRPRPAAAPRFSDYDHLARVKEWSAGGPGDV